MSLSTLRRPNVSSFMFASRAKGLNYGRLVRFGGGRYPWHECLSGQIGGAGGVMRTRNIAFG